MNDLFCVFFYDQMAESLHPQNPPMISDLWLRTPHNVFFSSIVEQLVAFIRKVPGSRSKGRGSDDPVFEPRCRLTMSGCTSDGKEVKDVFGRPKMCLGGLRTIKKPRCPWRGCPSAGRYLDFG